jgi:glycosyltransferase involved in cell wall biosynthesis
MKAQEIEHHKILMIVNEFPPTGESGVQRPLKFLKYLDRAGWQTYVVTPRKPSKTVLDHSLCTDIPAQSRIFYTPSWGLTGAATDKVAELRAKTQPNPLRQLVWKTLKGINDLIFPLDKQIGWVPFAILKAIYLIRRFQIRNVYITGYPFSAFLVGIALKRIFGDKIYWVADYRDAWQFEPMFEQNILPFRQAIIRKWDDRVLKTCDRIVFVTDFIKARYQQRFRWIADKAVVITNGYDEDDFTGIIPHHFERFTILYMGKIYSYKSDPIPLLKVISELTEQNLQYIHIGTITPDILADIHSHNFPFFQYQGYQSHSDALSYAAGADVNVIILNNDKESEGVYTGKVFELIRIGKPILAVGPKVSILKDLLDKIQGGEYASIGDSDAIRAALAKLLQKPTSQDSITNSITQFSREQLCRALIKLYA